MARQLYDIMSLVNASELCIFDYIMNSCKIYVFVMVEWISGRNAAAIQRIFNPHTTNTTQKTGQRLFLNDCPPVALKENEIVSPIRYCFLFSGTGCSLSFNENNNNISLKRNRMSPMLCNVQWVCVCVCVRRLLLLSLAARWYQMRVLLLADADYPLLTSNYRW